MLRWGRTLDDPDLARRIGHFLVPEGRSPARIDYRPLRQCSRLGGISCHFVVNVGENPALADQLVLLVLRWTGVVGVDVVIQEIQPAYGVHPCVSGKSTDSASGFDIRKLILELRGAYVIANREGTRPFDVLRLHSDKHRFG